MTHEEAIKVGELLNKIRSKKECLKMFDRTKNECIIIFRGMNGDNQEVEYSTETDIEHLRHEVRILLVDTIDSLERKLKEI